MLARRTIATLTATALLTGACGSGESHTPAPSSLSPPVKTLDVPSPPEGYIGSWPTVDRCSEKKVYALPQDPSPNIACSIGAMIKDRIDNGQEVDYISYGGGITSVDGLGSCVLNMLAVKTEIDGEKSLYAGLARIGTGKTAEAEVLFFPYNSTDPVETTATTLQLTDYGVYATIGADDIPVPIGVAVGQAYCQSGAP